MRKYFLDKSSANGHNNVIHSVKKFCEAVESTVSWYGYYEKMLQSVPEIWTRTGAIR